MLAMLPTACSYGWMAGRYPLAGSAYTYVARGLHPQAGFLAGWAMTMDYLLIPIFSVIYCAATMHRVVQGIPYALWAALFAALITFLNLRGIRTGVRTNQLLLGIMTTVIAAVMLLSVRYLFEQHGIPGLFSVTPFYQPGAFNLRTLATATSFAAITYIGFDAVTTLAEEVKDPKRTVGLATFSVCLLTGVGSVVMVYLGQLVWPQYEAFTDLDTAFLDVTQRVGGGWLFGAMALTLILGSFGAGLTGQAGASRLLFGMGRSGVLPRRFFSYVHPGTLQPSHNVWLVGTVALSGALLLDLEHTGELINFGAFLAFMGVNLAALRCALVERRAAGARGHLYRVTLLVPLIGLVSCFAIWLSLPAPARRVGFTWLVVGVAYQAIRTRGFRASITRSAD
jgi:amino acid transporter